MGYPLYRAGELFVSGNIDFLQSIRELFEKT